MMSRQSNGSTSAAAQSRDLPFALFGRGPGDFVIEFADDRRPLGGAGERRAPRPFERLLGTLSLADLNEYRQAAGLEPDLDAKALYALHDAADRFFPVRNDETGGRYLRNAYLKYLCEQAGPVQDADRTCRPFSA